MIGRRDVVVNFRFYKMESIILWTTGEIVYY